MIYKIEVTKYDLQNRRIHTQEFICEIRQRSQNWERATY